MDGEVQDDASEYLTRLLMGLKEASGSPLDVDALFKSDFIQKIRCAKCKKVNRIIDDGLKLAIPADRRRSDDAVMLPDLIQNYLTDQTHLTERKCSFCNERGSWKEVAGWSDYSAKCLITAPQCLVANVSRGHFENVEKRGRAAKNGSQKYETVEVKLRTRVRPSTRRFRLMTLSNDLVTYELVAFIEHEGRT